MTAAREGVVDGARDGEHLSALLRRETCRDERAALNVRLYHEGAEAHAADDAVAAREVVRPRRRTDREFRNQRAAANDDGVREFTMAGGVDAIEARAHHREGAAVLQCAAMRGGVDAHGAAARDGEAGPAEVGGEGLGRAFSAGAGVAAPFFHVLCCVLLCWFVVFVVCVGWFGVFVLVWWFG